MNYAYRSGRKVADLNFRNNIHAGGFPELSDCGATTTNCFVAFEGNGNVMALVNAGDGSLAAEYDTAPSATPQHHV